MDITCNVPDACNDLAPTMPASARVAPTSPSNLPGCADSELPLPPPIGASGVANPPQKRKTYAIKPLPQGFVQQPSAPVQLRAAQSASVVPSYNCSRPQPDITSQPSPPRGQIQRAATFLHRAPAPQSSSGAEMTVLADNDSTSNSTSIVQFQLSFRNIRARDTLSLAEPLAIVSCASGTPQGSMHWGELGRTERKASCTNPNFNHKIIVSLPKQVSETDDDVLRVDVYDLGGANVAVFDPLSSSNASYLGGACFSARSIVCLTLLSSRCYLVTLCLGAAPTSRPRCIYWPHFSLLGAGWMPQRAVGNAATTARADTAGVQRHAGCHTDSVLHLQVLPRLIEPIVVRFVRQCTNNQQVPAQLSRQS